MFSLFFYILVRFVEIFSLSSFEISIFRFRFRQDFLSHVVQQLMDMLVHYLEDARYMDITYGLQRELCMAIIMVIQEIGYIPELRHHLRPKPVLSAFKMAIQAEDLYVMPSCEALLERTW